MKIAYRIALFCGIAPLISGVIILMGCAITYSEDFLVAGFFNIIIGLGLFVLGLISLVVYLYLAKQKNIKGAIKKSIIAFLILLVNFPAAAGCIYTVYILNSVSVITIDNKSSETITDISMSLEGEELRRINLLMPETRIKKRYRFDRSGTVEYTFDYNGRERSGELVDWMSKKRGTTVVMTITDTGSIEVEENARSRW